MEDFMRYLLLSYDMLIVSGVRGHMELHNRLQNTLAIVLKWVLEVNFL